MTIFLNGPDNDLIYVAVNGDGGTTSIVDGHTSFEAEASTHIMGAAGTYHLDYITAEDRTGNEQTLEYDVFNNIRVELPSGDGTGEPREVTAEYDFSAVTITPLDTRSRGNPRFRLRIPVPTLPEALRRHSLEDHHVKIAAVDRSGLEIYIVKLSGELAPRRVEGSPFYEFNFTLNPRIPAQTLRLSEIRFSYKRGRVSSRLNPVTAPPLENLRFSWNPTNGDTSVITPDENQLEMALITPATPQEPTRISVLIPFTGIDRGTLHGVAHMRNPHGIPMEAEFETQAVETREGVRYYRRLFDLPPNYHQGSYVLTSLTYNEEYPQVNGYNPSLAMGEVSSDVRETVFLERGIRRILDLHPERRERP